MRLLNEAVKMGLMEWYSERLIQMSGCAWFRDAVSPTRKERWLSVSSSDGVTFRQRARKRYHVHG